MALCVRLTRRRRGLRKRAPADQLAANDVAALPLDALHQRLKNALAHRTLRHQGPASLKRDIDAA